MKTFLLSLAAALVSFVAAAQVPSVTVETVKGESFDTAKLLEEGTNELINLRTELKADTQLVYGID